jgi:DNA-binding MarR family transcriptional regulator
MQIQKADHLALLIADVFEAAGALRAHGDELAAAVGQTQARWQVLSVLSEGDWTVATAARRLGVTRQNVQRIADLLVADGLASYELNPRHHGSPLVRLTTDGRQALDVITAASLAWRRDAVDGISDEHLTIARHVLRALIVTAQAAGRR